MENNTHQVSPAPPEKALSRREFLAITGVVAGVAAAAQLLSQSAQASSDTPAGKHRWGMLIDINKCIGCNYCTYACQATNDLVDDMQYNVVLTETTQTGQEFFLSRPCMHCDHPPCVHVCPVNATYLREDGIVTMDYDRCIGCRYCQVACPYDVRVFNWKEHTAPNPLVPDFGIPEVERRPRGVMEKCTFCEHRIDASVERGLVPGIDVPATPACVVACPTGARVFGDLNDEHSPIREELSRAASYFRLREDLSTEPKVFYIPPQNKEG